MTSAGGRGKADHEAHIRIWAEGLKRSLLLAIGGLVLLGLVAGLLVLDPFGWRQHSAAVPTISAGPSSEAPGDAEAAASALFALTDNPANGVATEARQSLNVAVALPPGSKLAPEASSWGPDGVGGGTMNVVLSIPGQPDTRYVAVMVKEDGAWKVLGTLEQSEGPAAP